MTQDDLLYRFRLRVFAIAAELGNARAACRAMGILAHPSPTHLLSSRHCVYSQVDTRLGGCAVLSGGVTGRGRPEAARWPVLRM